MHAPRLDWTTLSLNIWQPRHYVTTRSVRKQRTGESASKTYVHLHLDKSLHLIMYL